MSTERAEERGDDEEVSPVDDSKRAERKRKLSTGAGNECDGSDCGGDSKRFAMISEGEKVGRMITPPKLIAATSGLSEKNDDERSTVRNPAIAKGFGSFGGGAFRSFEAVKIDGMEKSSFPIIPRPPSLTAASSSTAKEKSSQNLFLQVTKKSEDESEATNTDPSASPSSSGKGFVFGSNLSFRVIRQTAAEGGESQSTTTKTESTDKRKESESGEEQDSEKTKSTQQKPLLPSAEVITGEEKEKNVLQVFCLLYVFDAKTHSWIEKGRGTLHLNDMEESTQSRIVMRSQANLRVILNTLVWPQMVCEKVDRKSIRLTALNPEGGVRVCLVKCAVKDRDALHLAINERLQNSKRDELGENPKPSSPSDFLDRNSKTEKDEVA
ncbi:ran-binding protein 3-like [Oscarella lobularis]|uniref:ran-binding protein 3-like n=1 Tax=Oscarella lobularis TaxID=121494 RepID=UPI003313E989